jgi:hypothetical protein
MDGEHKSDQGEASLKEKNQLPQTKHRLPLRLGLVERGVQGERETM